MKELALHILDIAENSVAAQAHNIVIAIDEDLQADRLFICIQDDGRGMDEATAQRVLDPFITSRTTRKVGLGLPLLKAAAETCNGGLKIKSQVRQGTTVEVTFQHSHIDRMPLGDVTGTMMGLIVAHPEIHWRLEYTARKSKGQEVPAFIFDDQPVKEALGDLDLLCDPDVLAYLRTSLENGINDLRKPLIPTFPSPISVGTGSLGNKK
jgi:hypothetical protein